MPDFSSLDYKIIVEIFFRWFHFIFGILWIGHLYFFNFVNGPFQATLDADTKKKVVPELMPRALFWFRWGAMTTFITGYAIIIWKLQTVFGGDFKTMMASPWGQWISLGALLGTVMWFNVWFIIWPSQKKIIRAVQSGEKPDPAIVERARKTSKLNTFLSLPMLFAMGAATHFPYTGWFYQVAVVLLGFAIAQHLFKSAPKVGKLKS